MLDINTERGQKSLKDERYLAEWFEDRFGFEWVETPKDQPAAVDALAIKDKTVEVVIEVKCRYDMDIARLARNNYEWLVTWDKVQKTMSIANALGVPSIGILYMVNSGEVLIQQLSRNGLLIPNIRLATTETQATINGGTALRVNAYIDMRNAKPYSIS